MTIDYISVFIKLFYIKMTLDAPVVSEIITESGYLMPQPFHWSELRKECGKEAVTVCWLHSMFSNVSQVLFSN